MILDTIQHIDETILLSLQQWGHSSLDLFWQFVSNKWNSVPLYLLIFFLLFKKRPVKEAIFYLLCIGLLITVSDQMANLFKNGFERLRPCHLDTLSNRLRDVGYRCGGLYGFYSAHASNSFALAVFVTLVLEFKRNYFIIAFYTWAVLLSFSRIYLAAHYPSDVLVGALLGSFIAFVIYRLSILGSKIVFK
jgi:undecaprenyl-diphosphatase